MPSRHEKMAFALVALLLATPAFAQNAPPAERVIRMSGAVPGAAGQQATVRFAIYDAEAGGTLLWQETQAVAVDQAGQYTAFLGAMAAEGLPLDLFASGAPRWLAVEGPGGAAGPRTLLAAVPYAVAAATATNATTLGGRPATDFQLTPAARRKAVAEGLDAPAATDVDGPSVNNGSANFIGKFFNNVDLINSQLYDNGTGVGVGTTSPLDRFHVQFTNTAGSLTGYAVQNLGNTASSYSGMLFYDHTGALRQFQGYNNGTGEYRINNIAVSPSINFMTGSTSRFFINSSGNIGINQPSPTYRLDVQHGGSTGIHVESTSGFSVVDINASNGDAALRFARAGVNQWNIRNRPSDDYLEIFELGGGGTRMVIQDATGNVGIGAITPEYKLDTNGDIRTRGDFRVGGANLNGLKWVDAGGVLQADIFRFGAVNDRLYVTNNGTGNTTGVYLAAGATAWTSTSDERLKTDIAPLTGLLDKIKNIRVVNYNMFTTSADQATGRYKVDKTITPRVTKDGRSIKQQIGSIAQDWYKDFPEMVVEPQAADDYYGLDYDRIGVVALGAVKELNTVVEQKDAEIKALNDRIAALEAAIKSLTTAIQQQR